MRAPTVLLLLWLLGCGGASSDTPRDPPEPRTIRVVWASWLPYDRLGQAHGGGTDAPWVEVLVGLDAARAVRVLAHELIHAIGEPRHAGTPDCVMFAVIQASMPSGPCVEELPWALAMPFPWLVKTQDAALEQFALEAAHFWEQATGRNLFD